MPLLPLLPLPPPTALKDSIDLTGRHENWERHLRSGDPNQESVRRLRHAQLPRPNGVNRLPDPERQFNQHQNPLQGSCRLSRVI